MFQNGGTPELQHFSVGRNGEMWEAEKEQWGKEAEHQELVVSWKQLPFPFKCYPIFPVCSHISLPINALSVILEKLVGYWQKTCELNWQNSPANSFHPAVSALKMAGLCPSKRSLYRYMNNEIIELGLWCQHRARADEVVLLFSPVRLFETPSIAACQASLSLTIFQRLLNLMSIESVMPSNHFILCCPLLLTSIFSSIRVFSNDSAFHIRWPKYWGFSFNISPSNEYSRLNPLELTALISFLSEGFSRIFSSITARKHQFFSAQPSLWSSSHICTWLLGKSQPSFIDTWIMRSCNWVHGANTQPDMLATTNECSLLFITLSTYTMWAVSIAHHAQRMGEQACSLLWKERKEVERKGKK